MTEKIYIDGFAGLNNFEMELNRINVLIGPQASGKSVVAKLVYFSRWFPSYFFSQYEKKYGSTQIDKIAKDELRKMFHPNVFKQKFEIRYKNSYLDYSISNSSKTDNLKLSGNEHFVAKNQKKSENDIIKDDELFSIVKKNFGYKFGNDMLIIPRYFTIGNSKTNLIPASRTLLTQVRQIRLKVFDEGIQSSIDPFLSRFVASYHQIRDIYINNEKSLTSDKEDIVSPRIKEILNADVEFINNEDYLIYNDGRRNALTQASSGEQSLVPVLLLLKYLYENTLDERKHESIFFEEPELHIFPKFQKLLLQLLITVFNNRNNDGNLFITTHSPYILTSLNNLLQAGEMEKHLSKEKLKALEELVPKEYRINPKDFSAFQIINGKAKNIVDDETGLIAENIIDEVSDKDFDLFSQLIELDYGVES